MKATQRLHDLGQSLWLDNITRDRLRSGRLYCYKEPGAQTGASGATRMFVGGVAAPSTGSRPDVSFAECMVRGAVVVQVAMDSHPSAPTKRDAKTL